MVWVVESILFWFSSRPPPLAKNGYVLFARRDEHVRFYCTKFLLLTQISAYVHTCLLCVLNYSIELDLRYFSACDCLQGARAGREEGLFFWTSGIKLLNKSSKACNYCMHHRFGAGYLSRLCPWRSFSNHYFLWPCNVDHDCTILIFHYCFYMQKSIQTMKAIRVHKFGGPEVLQPDSGVQIPKPGSKDVLVQVRAVGVNPVETYIRAGIAILINVVSYRFDGSYRWL